MLRLRSSLRGQRGRSLFGPSLATSSPFEESAPPLRVPPISAAQRLPPARHAEVADLLNHAPALTVDAAKLRWALNFSFSGGDTVQEIARAKQLSPVADSDFDPDVFAADLFIDALIDRCMDVDLEGFRPKLDKLHLKRLITQPPRRAEDVTHRRTILGELSEQPALRSRFEQLYRALYDLRALFDVQGSLDEWDEKRRRLAILAGLRAVVDRLAGGFDGAQSGLRRLHDFGRHIERLPGYARLCELLDYEANLASTELRLRIGADGRIRHFEILGISENRGSPFYRSPWGRFWARLSMLARGYAVSDSEVVDRWLDAVFEGVLEPLPQLIGLISDMEFYLAAGTFKQRCMSRGLSVCFPTLDAAEQDAQAGRSLIGLFNPLLLQHPAPPVACDIRIERWNAITVITGPNSGGKTRLLQALAIAQLLGQSGMYVPARQARLCWARGLFVSLIEAAHADQREGRLGTEMLRIRQLFERARPNSLVILDELCSGTNPSEGEEIFRMVVSLLRALSPSAFITTHFLEFASRLQQEGRVQPLTFIQVELDDKEAPTFRFVPGVARTSLAHQTAARLGVTHEELLALVRRSLASG